jgi:hypothetical protein
MPYRAHLALLTLALLAALAGCSKPEDAVTQAQMQDAAAGQAVPGMAEVRAIAEDAFVFGLPLVMNYAVQYELFVDRNSGQFKAPYGELHNEHRVFTYEDTAVVTPNSDTPYSAAGLDLRAEPMVISVPAVDPRRYYSVQLVDWNTFNFGYIGSRATRHEAGNYLVVGPGWTGDKPPGIREVFRSSSQLAMALFRTQLFDAKDMGKVEKVQAGYNL